MDLLNKAKDKITKTGTGVAKKAKDLTGLAKMNAQINSNESKIRGTYEEIGKYVYENQREDAPAEIAEWMTEIDEAMAEIDSLKAEILKMKGNVKCEECEKEVPDTYAFCPYCGNKMPEPVVEVIDEEEIKEVEEAEEAEEAAEEEVKEDAAE